MEIKLSKLVLGIASFGSGRRCQRGEISRNLKLLSSLVPLHAPCAAGLDIFSLNLFADQIRRDGQSIRDMLHPSDLFHSDSPIGRALDSIFEIRPIKIVRNGEPLEIQVMLAKGTHLPAAGEIELCVAGKKNSYELPAPDVSGGALAMEGRIKPKSTDLTLTGLGMTPGFGRGRAFYLGDWEKDLRVEKITDLAPIQVSIEESVFRFVMEEARGDHEKLVQEIPDDRKIWKNISALRLDFYTDEGLTEAVVKMIKEQKVNAAFAFDAEIKRQIEALSNFDNPQLARTVDLLKEVARDVLGRLIDKAPGGGKKKHKPELSGRLLDMNDIVIVAEEVLPGDFDALRQFHDRLRAVVTRRGGPTAHAVLIGSEFGIPVVGADISAISERDELLVNGLEGEVHINPSQQTLGKFEGREKIYTGRVQIIHSSVRGQDSITKDGVKIVLLANVSGLPEALLLERYEAIGGIGLWRFEGEYWGDAPPTEAKLFKTIRRVGKGLGEQGLFSDSELTVRAPDFGEDKVPPSYLGIPPEASTMLGLTGPRVYFYNDVTLALLRTFHRALLRASAEFPGLRIMYPKITVPEEVLALKDMLAQHMSELETEGVEFNKKIPVGIMMETPAAFNIADYLSTMVDFFSFGTNDLIQYTLLINRANEYVAKNYDPHRLSVMWPLRRGIASANKTGIDCSVCGDMAGDPLSAFMLFGMGVKKFSMVPRAIPLAKHLFRTVMSDEARESTNAILASKALVGSARERRAKIKSIIQKVVSPETFRVIEELDGIASA